MRNKKQNITGDLPPEDQIKEEQEQILQTEEERARLERLDAIRRRVEIRNQILQRNFGVRSGTAILGFR